MPRGLYIALNPETKAWLKAMAKAQRRHFKDQAAILIEQGLHPKYRPLPESRAGQPLAGTLVALIQLKEAVPHMIRLVQFWWRGPFEPRKRVHWEMLWGLDLFAGRIPIVKTMIALNVLFWIWIAVTRS